jgi:transposase
VLRVAARHTDATTTWLKQIQTRRNANIAAVALANKHARIVWALLAHDREYKPGSTVTSP